MINLMKFMSKFEFNKWISTYLLILAAIFSYSIISNFEVVDLWFENLFKVLSPFIAGIIIAYLLDIPCSTLEKSLVSAKKDFISKRARGISVLITILAALLVVTVVLLIIIPEIAKSIRDFISNFSTYRNQLFEYIKKLTDNEDISYIINMEDINNLTLKNILDTIGYKSIWEFIISVLSVSTYFINTTIAIISSIYLLLEAKSITTFFKKIMNAFLPEKTSQIIQKYLHHTNSYFKKFLYCLLIDGFIVGVLSVIGLRLIGTKYALLLGIVEGLLNMIPYFGAIVGSVIVVIVVLLTDGVGKAVATGIFLLVLQQIDGNIIKPKLFENSFQISPFVVIVSITVGGAYYGVIGMVIAIPVMAVLKMLLNDALGYVTKKRKEKDNQIINEES